MIAWKDFCRAAVDISKKAASSGKLGARPQKKENSNLSGEGAGGEGRVCVVGALNF